MVSFVFILYTITITYIRDATSAIPAIPVIIQMCIIVALSFAVEELSEILVTPSGSVEIVVVSKDFGVVDEGCGNEVVEERDEDFVMAKDVSSSLQSVQLNALKLGLHCRQLSLFFDAPLVKHFPSM